VNFYSGNDSLFSKTNSYYVRCVRWGQFNIRNCIRKGIDCVDVVESGYYPTGIRVCGIRLTLRAAYVAWPKGGVKK
jgi:hypothetical protein